MGKLQRIIGIWSRGMQNRIFGQILGIIDFLPTLSHCASTWNPNKLSELSSNHPGSLIIISSSLLISIMRGLNL